MRSLIKSVIISIKIKDFILLIDKSILKNQ